MTTRVFEFRRQPQVLIAAERSRRADAPLRAKTDLRGTIVLALVVVPFAGASEAPAGWLATTLTAVGILALAATNGWRVPWPWLAAVAAGLGLALPRGQWPYIGPALFVATVLCVALWLAHSGTPRRRDRQRRPEVGSPERTAQVMMGLSGEREVGRVLADELPQDYTLINGLALRGGGGDIDHLVVGPTGLFLLETKTMSGHIVCGPDGNWRRTRVARSGAKYPAYIGDPAAQVQRNIFRLREVLRRRVPAVLSASVWIEGLVVFAHPATQLQAWHSRIPAVLLSDITNRICQHAPRHRLQPDEIEAIVAALIDESRIEPQPTARQTAQALVELAVLLPVLLALIFGTLAVSRLVQAHSAVVAVAHEAARAGALASTPSAAVGRIQDRAVVVAQGLGLEPGALVIHWDVSRFSASPAQVEASVEYRVDFSDLPLVGGAVAPVVSAEHTEWLDPFRSGIGAPSGGSD